MAKPAFWPGYRWRVLAHERTQPGPKGHYTGPVYDARSQGLPGGAWEFDELCIDNWLHLEQMDSRDWWLGIGNGDDYWHVNVHVDRDGQAHVRMEKQT